MSVELVETLATDNTDDSGKKAIAVDLLLSVALTSSEESPVGYESEDVMYVTFVSDEGLAADEELWDKLFAESQDFLERMVDEIEAKYHAGLTEDFDPDTHPDLQ